MLRGAIPTLAMCSRLPAVFVQSLHICPLSGTGPDMFSWVKFVQAVMGDSCLSCTSGVNMRKRLCPNLHVFIKSYKGALPRLPNILPTISSFSWARHEHKIGTGSVATHLINALIPQHQMKIQSKHQARSSDVQIRMLSWQWYSEGKGKQQNSNHKNI